MMIVIAIMMIYICTSFAIQIDQNNNILLAIAATRLSLLQVRTIIRYQYIGFVDV
jgi:hypothetical protein